VFTFEAASANERRAEPYMAWLFFGAVLGVVGTLLIAAAISALTRRRERIATPDGGVESSVDRRQPMPERTSDG
jgi:predicted alpha/beta-fold hydrolase